MSEMQRVAKNTAFQAIGKGLGTVLGLVSSIIVIQHLRDAQYGVYTTAFAYLQLFGTLSDFGLYIILLKYFGIDTSKDADSTSADRTRHIVNNIFTLRIVINIGLLLMACGLVWFVPNYSTEIRLAVLVVALNFFFISMNQLLTAVYQKHLAMYTVAFAEVFSKVLLFVATLVAVYVLHGNVLVILATVVFAGGINFLQLFIGALKLERLQLAWDWTVWKMLLAQSWPIALSIAFNIVYFKMDTIILSWFYDDSVVGVYGAPYKILEVIITLPAMVVGLVMPLLSRAYENRDTARFKQLYQQSFGLLAMIAVPMIFGAMVVAQPVMEFIASEDFSTNMADLGPLLQILTFAVASIFIGTLTGYMVVIINKQKVMLFAYAFVATTALAAYLYLIPKYSYFGAAGVTVYAEGSMLLFSLSIIYYYTRTLPNFSQLALIILSSAIMGGLLWLLSSWSFFILIPLGIAVYGLCLLAFQVVSADQIRGFIKQRS